MTPAPVDQLAEELTAILRTPRGTMTLRPLQARALAAMRSPARRTRGVFVSAAIGMGKTLTSALAMTVVGGERPMMFTSASIIPQTESDFAALRLHWQMPSFYRLEPYEKLGMAAYAGMLDEFQPTCLILDEAHKLKHVTVSARAKRMARFVEAHPDVPVIVLSGSPGAAVEEYAHLLWWVLGEEAVLELLPDLPGTKRFKEFCDDLAEDDVAKEEFGSLLAGTPGCIISPETYQGPLEIRHVVLEPPSTLEPYFAELRDVAEAPDGWALDGPAEAWSLARCLANGFYYEHVPRPPETYREAWRAWREFFTDACDDPDLEGAPYDTPGQVAGAVLAGTLGSEGRRLLDAWLAEKAAYQFQTRTVWFDSFVLDWAIQWGREHAPADTKAGGGCIVWVEQIGMGMELARRTGWPYYSSGALDSRGRHAQNATAPVIICARKSCFTGLNLQHRYSQNAFLSPPSGNEPAEQGIGRTHRSGQPQPRVTAVMLISCIEDWGAIEKARREARSTELELQTVQKLSLAEHVHAKIPDASTHSAWRAAAKLDAVVIVEA